MPHIGILSDNEIPKITDKETILGTESAINEYALNNKKVYFEDLNFSTDKLKDNLKWLEELGLSKVKNCLFIIHNDVFQYFVEFATMVISRNRIDDEKGIVQKGALWTEEHLPPETYLFSHMEDNNEAVGDKANAFEWIKGHLNNKVIHLGGDETVGKGFVELSFTKSKKEKQNG